MSTETEDDNNSLTEFYTTFFTYNQRQLDLLIDYKLFNPMAITIQNYLTDKQLDFLMSNTLSIFDKESATYTFIREIFKADENNIPLNDSIFLCSIFELVNLYLYLGEPYKIIPTLNKKNNLKAISNVIKSCPYNFNEIYQNAETLGVGFIYRINPNKQTIKIEIGIWDLYFTYIRPYDKEATSLFNKVFYKVDNLNEFLFKVCTIYDEFIELMPQEDLDL